MKRLTNPVKLKRLNKFPIDWLSPEELIYRKLGQYEDIDEKAGIDWFTLFEASKKIVIKNDDESLEEIEHYAEEGCGLTNYVFDLDSKVIMFTSYGCELTSLILDFKDFGKTWALTKEGLER